MKNHYLLYLNTTLPHGAELAVISQRQIFKKRLTASRSLSERLLPTLARLLESQGIGLGAITAIVVVTAGGSFSALRAGVVMANALGFALKIPVYGSATALPPENLQVISGAKKVLKRVRLMYASPPHITPPKQKGRIDLTKNF